jgi:hypothetical protein
MALNVLEKSLHLTLPHMDETKKVFVMHIDLWREREKIREDFYYSAHSPMGLFSD